MGLQKIRILVVSSTLSEGGAERFASTLVTHLDRSRFEPRLCLMRGTVSYPLPVDVEPTLLHRNSPLDLPGAIFRLRLEVQRARPQVVVGNVLFTSWVAAAALLSLRNPPALVARFGAPPAREFAPNERYGRWGALPEPPIKMLSRRATTWVANSRGLGEDVASFLEVPKLMVKILYNPVDFTELDSVRPSLDTDSSQSTPTIISVGRLSREKRPDVLLDAFQEVRRRRNARLLICGDGPLKGWLADQVVQRGLQLDVSLPGFRPDVFDLMKQSDVFVLSSDYEGMPNALIEAQGLGLPAISTRCGPEEVIENGHTGLLIPVSDPSALAVALCTLLDDPARAKEMGRAASERVRRLFQMDQQISAWQELLQQVEDRHRCVESRA